MRDNLRLLLLGETQEGVSGKACSRSQTAVVGNANLWRPHRTLDGQREQYDPPREMEDSSCSAYTACNKRLHDIEARVQATQKLVGEMLQVVSGINVAAGPPPYCEEPKDV